MSAWWVKCDTVALQSDYHAGDMLADPGSEHSCRENVSECWIGCTASVLLFAWRLRRFLSERNVSFQCTPVIRYSAGDSTEAAAGTVCLCVITCASQCCSRFHLWFAPTPALSLSLSPPLSKCLSVTALFVLLESLQNGVPSKGPFVCRFDYERAISPPGADGVHPQVTAGVWMHICVYVCVCVWERERVCVYAKSQTLRVRNKGTVRWSRVSFLCVRAHMYMCLQSY